MALSGYDGTPVQRQFEAAMARRSLVAPKRLIADGKIHRCNTKARNGKGDGAYILHLDGVIPAGGFQNYQDGQGWENWKFDNGRDLTHGERAEVKRKAEATAKAHDEAKGHERQRAAQKAARLWESAPRCPANHPYLRKKNVQPHDARLKYGSALLSVRDEHGALVNLQFIRPDGSKTFLKGGRVKGCYHRIAGDDSKITIGEGFATMASINEAIGATCIVAFSDGNVGAVAGAVREQHPAAEIIIAADDDWKTKGNPGLTKATEAARTVGARLAVPDFGANRRTKDTDFNDLADLIGVDAVKRCIDEATAPDPAPESTDSDAEIARLAQLSAFEYERERKDAAKKLGVGVGALDKAVTAARPTTGSEIGGTTVEVTNVEPWPDPVDGETLLDAISDALQRHFIMRPEQSQTCGLYAVFTHGYEMWRIAPRLGVQAPSHSCGKSELLRRFELLVNRPISGENFTAAVLFRLIHAKHPTLLLDEFDNMPLDDQKEIRGILNSGYERGGMSYRCVGDNNELRAFSTFAPLIYAMIGQPWQAFNSRTIRIEMRRATPAEARSLKSMEDGGEEQQRFVDLGRKAARWIHDNRDRLAQAKPDMAGLVNRTADNWRPLFSIADVAGGKWPKLARDAAKGLAGKVDVSFFEETLEVIRQAFIVRKGNGAAIEMLAEVSSKDIVDRLVEVEGGPWAEWGRDRKPITQNALARLLKPFKVSPVQIGKEHNRKKGYRYADMKPVFDAYLDTIDSTSGTQGERFPSTTEGPPEADFGSSEATLSPTPLFGDLQPLIRSSASATGTSEKNQPLSQENGCTVGNAQKPNNDGLMNGCTDADPGNRGLEREAETPSDDAATTSSRPNGRFQGVTPYWCARCGREEGILEEVTFFDPDGTEQTYRLHKECLDGWVRPDPGGPLPPPDPSPGPGDPLAMKASVPFMITGAMKQRLTDLGYSPEQIADMTPGQAHEIIDSNRGTP